MERLHGKRDYLPACEQDILSVLLQTVSTQLIVSGGCFQACAQHRGHWTSSKQLTLIMRARLKLLFRSLCEMPRYSRKWAQPAAAVDMSPLPEDSQPDSGSSFEKSSTIQGVAGASLNMKTGSHLNDTSEASILPM